jgi:pimeloyl-ACP methyl ester carboxylesterase
MPKVKLRSGLTIHYQQAGEGPDLVMVHGLSGNLASWNLRIVPLLWDNFRVLTYDLRGHGYSDTPPTGYTLDDMVGDLFDLLDELDIDRPSVVGHSYGADLALYFALLHPDRVETVIAIEAALPAMIHLRSVDDWEGWTYWTDVLNKAGFEVPPERRTDTDFLLRRSLEVPKRWGPLNGLPRNTKHYLKLLDETSIALDSMVVGSLTIDRIQEIETPVVLLYSDQSAFMGTCDELCSRLPNATKVLLPRSDWGHFAPLEQPELVTEQIERAMSALTKEGRG